MKAWFWLCLLPLSAGAATVDRGSDSKTGAALTEETYSLGYEVYLQSGNLEQAFQLAAEVLRQKPDDTLWLTRYAKGGEWTGQPALALQAWLKLARKTDNQQAWDAVARLAPSLLNDEALLAWQQRRLQTEWNNRSIIKQLTQTYERLGQMREGLAYLEHLQQQHPSQMVLEAAADLAERGGADQQAITLLNTLINRYGAQESWVLRRSGIHYARGELELAWQELQALQSTMAPTQTGYWQTYAELSRMLSHLDSARAAYQILVDTKTARPQDLQHYVTALQGKDGLAAARLSETLFRMNRGDQYLLTALYLYQRENHLDAAAALLAGLSSEQRAHFQQNITFLELRGQLYWKGHHLALARADFEHGLQLAPRQVSMTQSLIGVLIEQHDSVALTHILTRLATSAKTQPTLWSAMASGWNLLEQPRKALPYLRAYSRANPNNTLGLLALADAYYASGDFIQAKRLREYLATRQNPVQSSDNPLQVGMVQEALLALSLSASRPDASLTMLRTRLRQNRQAPDSQRSNRELALSWLLAHDRQEAARLWVDRTYAGQGPAWAMTELALQQQNASTQQSLLEKDASRLPRMGRIQLASNVGWIPEAESLAFADAEQHSNDNISHQQFQDLTSQQLTGVAANIASSRQNTLQRERIGLSWSAAPTSVWRLQLAADHIRQSSRDLTRLAALPDNEERLALQLTQTKLTQSWFLGLMQTQALARFVGANVGQDMPLASQISWRWRADYNAAATETSALLVAGAKDQLSGGLAWTLGSSQRLSAGVIATEFYSQNRQRLGQGQVATLAYDYRLPSHNHPQNISLLLTTARYDSNNQPLEPALQAVLLGASTSASSLLIPSDYHEINVSWLLGKTVSTTYSRQWQPCAEVGVNYANTSGVGYLLALGGNGPLVGNDRLTVSLRQASSGQNLGDRTAEAVATYQYFY